VKNSLDPCQLLAMHHQTALLESVGWNEKEFTELVKHVTNYLNHKAQNSKDIKYNDITLLLESVHNFWGPDSKEVLESIFNIENFYLNLNVQRSKDVN
jgi:hypothetical protein